jgi:hypothetical protein
MLGDVAVQTTTGKFSVFANEGILSFITSASLEALLAVQVISGATTTVKSTGMVGILGGAEVSIGALGAVAIAAAGAVGLSAGGAVGIAAAGAVGIEAPAIGLNASLVASLGIIQQNGPVVVAVPPAEIIPVPPIPVPPVLADNPKLMHVSTPTAIPETFSGLTVA